MKRPIVSIVAALLSALFISGCQSFRKEPPQDFVLKVIETTDVHGSLVPYDFIKDKETDTSLAQVYSLVKEERAKENQEVLLLDNGDILQGQPIVYYSNFEAVDKPHIAAEMMNYMDYDAGSVGNHDIEAGHAVYDKLVDEFDFPWLAANVVVAGSDKPYFQPYEVFEMNGAKIVVLGMCTPGVPTWLPENLWEGMEFKGMVETAQTWVPLIEEKEEPDVLIGLFHAGTDFTYSGYGETDSLNPNASLLVAEQVPGFDLVLTGHDHQTHNDVVQDSEGNDVLVLGGLNAARAIASATFIMDYQEETDEWDITVSGDITDGNELPVDSEFSEVFADLTQEVKDYVGKPIGTFTRTIASPEAMFQDAPFVDLIHVIQLELTGADVSFAAPLSSNAEISEGEVYVRDMFQLYKYENLLYTMELTGKEIKDFMEYSYGGWFNTMAGPDDHLIAFKKDENGEMIWNERYSSYDTVTRYYNYDSAAGIDYVVDVSKEPGDRITINGFSDGRTFDESALYKVAINSYRASGGGGHLTKGAGLDKAAIAAKTIDSTDIDLRYYLMKWIENAGTVTPEALGNWSVEPAAWWEKGKEMDYQIIYGSK
ncbi:MAG: bifunctional UDP-sugar hydrolase/5'-nucleotidase [Spirochaetales bacterium]|nr:bifunctional UDP-sugar hydrolase/5'-nucleotidase [Spirochaetales bacterium]